MQQQDPKQEGEDHKKKIYIKSEHTQQGYNNSRLEIIIQALKKCLDELKACLDQLTKFPLLTQGDYVIIENEKKDAFNKINSDFQKNVNSIIRILKQNQEVLTIDQNQQQNQIQIQENIKKQQEAQIQEMDQKILKPIPLDNFIFGANVQIKNEKFKNTQDQQIQTEKIQCHIDHQQVLTFLLQSKLISNMSTFPQCICNERFKITHLINLSNRNLFEQLLFQQVENIFENGKKIYNKEVFKCKNSFCTFKCFVERNVDKGQKFYCTLCEEYSVEQIKEKENKKKN